MQTIRLHFAFFVCVCMCVCHCCRQWLLKKNLTGGEWEWSMKRAVMKIHIFHLYTYTHIHSGSCLLSWDFCVFVCAWDTWLRSIMKVLRPTDTDSLLCIHVKMPSTRPISASFAGTSEPIRAMNTIRPTCKIKIESRLSVEFQKLSCLFAIMEI